MVDTATRNEVPPPKRNNWMLESQKRKKNPQKIKRHDRHLQREISDRAGVAIQKRNMVEVQSIGEGRWICEMFRKNRQGLQIVGSIILQKSYFSFSSYLLLCNILPHNLVA